MCFPPLTGIESSPATPPPAPQIPLTESAAVSYHCRISIQKAEKTEDNGEIKDYIIVAKNEKAYNRALNATGEEAIKNGEKFIDNNIRRTE